MRPQIIALTWLLAGSVAGANPVIFSNGQVTGSTAWCDSGPNRCGGSGTWILYDDFSLRSAATVTGFTVGEIINPGSPSDYIRTYWSIWGADPLLAGVRPLASGNAIATLQSRGNPQGPFGEWLFTVGGLAVSLNAETTYWLGATHLFVRDPRGAAIQPGTVRLRASGNNIVGFKQSSTNGLRSENPIHDTYFTLTGSSESPLPTPEPGSFLLVGSALVGMRRLTKRRSRGAERWVEPTRQGASGARHV